MTKKAFLILGILYSNILLATPEIKGEPKEIEEYLNNIPKQVTISATSKKIVTSESAEIVLSVETESSTLASALKENFDTRIDLKKQLETIGIQAKDIKESKFSSTPTYGIFGDEPKSYKVDNTITIIINSEQEMISVAKISDSNKKIRYISSQPIISNQESLHKELVAKAMEKAKAKAVMYQNTLDVKLVPIYFEQQDSQVLHEMRRVKPKRKSLSSVASYYEHDSQSFGEEKLSATMVIHYKVYSNSSQNGN